MDSHNLGETIAVIDVFLPLSTLLLALPSLDSQDALFAGKQKSKKVRRVLFCHIRETTLKAMAVDRISPFSSSLSAS